MKIIRKISTNNEERDAVLDILKYDTLIIKMIRYWNQDKLCKAYGISNQ